MLKGDLLSIPAKVLVVIVMMVIVSLLGFFGAVQINKTATLHKLNYLHLKYNQRFFEHVLEIDKYGRNPGVLREDIKLIRAQPITCLENMGSIERVLLAALGTSRAIDLCSEDMGLADATLALITGYEQGRITDQQLTTGLRRATEGFLANSAEFEPLVDATARVVYRVVLIVLVSSSLGTFLFALILIGSITRDYRQINKTQQDLRRFELIASSATDMLMLVDRDYRFLAVNKAFLAAQSESSDEIVGQTIAEVLGNSFFKNTVRPCAEHCLAGETIRIQTRCDFT